MNTTENCAANIRFHRFIVSAPAPTRADRSALGTMPTRAFRYCDAMTSASAFGWYLFAPMPISLLFDVREVLAAWPGADWFPLSSVQFPGFPPIFDSVAPDDIKGCAPPFLGSLPEPGVVQIWTGLAARTTPGWSTLIRPCANLPATKGFDAFEGIVETDSWFGPLFVNLRLLRTDCPIDITSEWPIAMAQPVPQLAYSDIGLKACPVTELTDFSEGDWQDYRDTVVSKSVASPRQPGAYAVELRKRRRALAIDVTPGDATGR